MEVRGCRLRLKARGLIMKREDILIIVDLNCCKMIML